MMHFLTLLLLLLPALAWADATPAKTRVNNRCQSYRMCDAQASTGICTSVSDADEIVLQIARFAHYTFYSIQSTATNYSCDIMTNNQGYDANNTADQVNTISITDEAPVYTMGVLLRYLWITCPTLADNQVTIDVVVCVME